MYVFKIRNIICTFFIRVIDKGHLNIGTVILGVSVVLIILYNIYYFHIFMYVYIIYK